MSSWQEVDFCAYFCSVDYNMEEIRNKVKESGLIQMDLAHYKPTTELVGIDLADQLWQGLVVKEKDFRAWIKENDWSAYAGKACYIYCSTDAIIPVWAFMLVTASLGNEGVESIVGTKDELQRQLISKKITSIDLSEFQEGRIIIKGCADIPSPAFAMTELVKHLQPVAKSIMFGEPCSTVPVYKQRK